MNETPINKTSVIRDGGPVYPTGMSNSGGMSIRDKFAETAMREMVAHYSPAQLPVDFVAARAVQMADALVDRLLKS